MNRPTRQLFQRAAALAFLFSLIPLGAHAQVTPNDPLYSLQETYLSRIGIPSIWETTTGSSQTKIAVIAPNGVRASHEDLGVKTTVRTDRGTSLENPADPFFFPQATVAAGVAAAATSNGKGIAGVHWNASILSYDPSEWVDRPVGNFDLGYLSLDEDALDSDINSARQDGARVLLIPISLLGVGPLDQNYVDLSLPPGEIAAAEPPDDPEYIRAAGEFFLSLVTSGQSPIYEASVALRGAYLEDRVSVIPVGDYNGAMVGLEPTETLPVPAFTNLVKNQLVISVGSSTEGLDDPYLFSGTSPAGTDASSTHLDFIAPGEEIWAPTSAVDSGSDAYEPVTTTVAASALVGGVSALLLDVDSNLTPEDVRQVLRRTAVDSGAPGYDRQSGFGRIDAAQALSYVQDRTFTRGVATNGTSQLVASGGRNIYSGPWASHWGNLSSAYYYVDVHEVTFSVSLPQVVARDLWVRYDGTRGWSAANDNFQDPYAYVEINGDEATLTTYVFDIKSGTGGRDPGWWPTSPSGAQVAYTIAADTPPPPAFYVHIDGPPSPIADGEVGTWTADVHGGVPSFSYEWSYLYPCSEPDPPPCNPDKTGACTESGGVVVPMGPQCDVWTSWGSGQAVTGSFDDSGADNFVELRVEVTDATGATRTGEGGIYVTPPSLTGGDGVAGASRGSGSQGVEANVATAHADGARGDAAGTPEVVALEAYPNPVGNAVGSGRAATTVRFGLPDAADIALVVYDVLGREVAQLTEGERAAGWHTARFEAAGLPSGRYVVRLTAGSVVETLPVTVLR